MRGKSHAAIVSCIIVEHPLDARSEDIVGALPTRTCCRVHSFVVTELGVKKKALAWLATTYSRPLFRADLLLHAPL